MLVEPLITEVGRGLTVIGIVLEVAGLGEGHVAVDIILHETWSPFASIVVV
jgi:hypothetical protein